MQFVNRYWVFLTSLFLLCYLLVFSLHGFDLTDEGYVLYSYQNFFESPQSVVYAFGMYLTVFVGGLWEMIFGDGGWYSFRVFNSVIIVMAYVFICFLLKKYWNFKWVIFLSFFIVVMNMNIDHGTLVFHYYTFSGFTNTMIGCLIYKGFEKKSQRILFLSSVLLGLNIFVRIPNLTLCAIPYAVLFVSYFYEKNRQKVLRGFIAITMGLLTGIFVIVALIYSLGHSDLIINKLLELSNIAQDPTDGHGITSMLKVTFVHLKSIVAYMAIFFLVFKSLFFLLRKSKQTFLLRSVLLTFAICFPIVAYYFLPTLIHPLSPRMTFLISCAYCMMAYAAYENKGNKHVIYLVTIFFLISVLQPLGSDWGIGNMGAYSIWGLMVVSFTLFLVTISRKGDLPRFLSRSAIYAAIALLLISFGKNCYSYCYRDDGYRFAKTCRIKSSPLATVRTSVERGEEMDALIKECNKYMKSGDVVLFASDMPGMHYLTKTKAWLGNPWPMLKGANYLQEQFAKNEQGKHFVIVERKPQIFNNSIKMHYLSNLAVVHQYIQRNNYDMVWCSENYRIYK